MMNKSVLTSLALTLMIALMSCNGQQGPSKEKQENAAPAASQTTKDINYLSFTYPAQSRLYTLGDTIQLTWTRRQPADSSVVQFNGHKLATLSGKAVSFTIETKGAAVGIQHIRMISYYNKETESDNLRVKLASDIVPERYSCKVIRSYPHDPAAYTQGLFMHEGRLYEGTGQYGESSLRKVDLASGSVIESLSIPERYFGEGIAAYDDKIIQLTWRSKIGFVYDQESFQLLQKVQYPYDGWGITFDGEHLLMSDGTATLYFLEPGYFGEVARQEVWNHEGPVEMLNELEYVNGLLYANVWQTSDVLVIEPESGRVLRRIDCSQLVPEQYRADRDNVLNGIAYKADTETFLLTGKRWPKLFEVRFEKAK
ncbi:MAG: glutaminyl-peptide cyclotransferase [Bacteroidales bacterium]